MPARRRAGRSGGRAAGAIAVEAVGRDGCEVDTLWPAARLIVEVDGFAFHASREAFERDRDRDARLPSRGHRVMRVTWRRLAARPRVVTARLGAALLPPGGH